MDSHAPISPVVRRNYATWMVNCNAVSCVSLGLFAAGHISAPVELGIEAAVALVKFFAEVGRECALRGVAPARQHLPPESM